MSCTLKEIREKREILKKNEEKEKDKGGISKF